MLNKLSIRYGLILAGISVAVNVLLYLIGINILAMGIIGIVVGIATLVLWIMFAIRVRKANGGLFTFGEAFRSLVIIAIIPIVAGVVWQMLLTKVIDPSYTEKMVNESISMVEDMGVTMTEEMETEMIASIEESSSLNGQIKGMCITLAVMAVIAMIVALIIKKEKGTSGSLDTM